MRKLEEDVKQKEECNLCLSEKVEKYERTEAEMEAELQNLQAGEERRGCNASQAVNCCMEELGIMGAEKAVYHFELLRGMLQRMFEAQTRPEQMPGKE